MVLPTLDFICHRTPSSLPPVLKKSRVSDVILSRFKTFQPLPQSYEHLMAYNVFSFFSEFIIRKMLFTHYKLVEK